jgi:hypothetical protein
MPAGSHASSSSSISLTYAVPAASQLVTIATYGDALEASLARGYLESLDIPAFLADEQTIGMAWHLGVALGGIKLQVPDVVEAEARQALADRHGEQLDDDERYVATAEEPESAPADDADEAPPTLREQTADRAWRGAIICVFAFPCELYIFWLLLKVFLSDERLDAPHRRRAIYAAIINLPLVIATLLWLKSMLSL